MVEMSKDVHFESSSTGAVLATAWLLVRGVVMAVPAVSSSVLAFTGASVSACQLVTAHHHDHILAHHNPPHPHNDDPRDIAAAGETEHGSSGHHC